jgi:hypothetical protein
MVFEAENTAVKVEVKLREAVSDSKHMNTSD